MGLSNHNQSAPKTFINIVGGRLAVKAKSKDDVSPSGVQAKTRISTNKSTGEQKEVHEFIYNDVSGILESVVVEKNETLKAYQYLITIDDVGDKYVISIPADSKYGDSFVTKLMNVKKGEYIKIAPYDFEDAKKPNPHTGKPQRLVGVTIIQNDVKIQPYYIKETPNGRPVPESENMDEDDFKSYMIKVRKFYRGQVDVWNLKEGQIEQPKPEPQSEKPSLNAPKINEPESISDLDSDNLPF